MNKKSSPFYDKHCIYSTNISLNIIVWIKRCLLIGASDYIINAENNYSEVNILFR